MSQENVETIKRMYDVLAQPGREGILDFYDPEVVVLNAASSPDTAPYLGHEGLVEWVRDVQAGLGGTFRVEADDIIDVDESRAVVVGRVSGKGRVSGLPVEVSLTTVFTLRNGAIVRLQAYDTKAEALEAVGLRE